MWNLFTATITLRTYMRGWWGELHCFAYLRLCLHFCFAEFLFFNKSEYPACIRASAKGISETSRCAPRTGAFWSKYRFKFQHVQTRVRMLDRMRGRRQSHLTQNIKRSQWCKEPWWKRLYETTVSPQLLLLFKDTPHKETDSVMYYSFTKCM